MGTLAFSSPETGNNTIYVHASQVFGLGLNYSTLFPGFPSCQWQTVGLLSLHNHLSQSFLHDIYLAMEFTEFIVLDKIFQKRNGISPFLSLSLLLVLCFCDIYISQMKSIGDLCVCVSFL